MRSVLMTISLVPRSPIRPSLPLATSLKNQNKSKSLCSGVAVRVLLQSNQETFFRRA